MGGVEICALELKRQELELKKRELRLRELEAARWEADGIRCVEKEENDKKYGFVS